MDVLLIRNGVVENCICADSVARAQEFTTFRDGQTALAVHVVQGERELVSDCRSLARFELRGIPPMSAGAARIRVSFQVDADGLLSVTACEQLSGVKAAVTVRPSYGLSDDEIADMLQQSFLSAGADRDARALREQQVEADRLFEATRSALDADSDLLTEAERPLVESLLSRVLEARGGTDADVVRQAVDALARGTEHFAARRMDRAISRALSGRRIDQID